MSDEEKKEFEKMRQRIAILFLIVGFSSVVVLFHLAHDAMEFARINDKLEQDKK